MICAQIPLVSGRSRSENFTFSGLQCEKILNKKASNDETRKHSGSRSDLPFKNFSLKKNFFD